jgi:hypothetical protein
MIERSKVAFWGIVVSVPLLLLFGFGAGYTRPGVAIRGEGFGVAFVLFAAEVLLAFRWVTNEGRFGGATERKFTVACCATRQRTRVLLTGSVKAVERKSRDM